VEIFSTCVCMISAMSGYNNGVTRTLLNPVLPSFSERFVHGLQVPDGIHSDSCLKTDIIKGKYTKLLQYPILNLYTTLHYICVSLLFNLLLSDSRNADIRYV
jgi:hypothetical protein